MINKKRLIITSIISILLVSTLFLGSTYSIFTSQDIDEDKHVYKTGDLEIDYLSNDIKMTNVTPMTVEEAIAVTPHRITVTNNGNVTYMFNLILSDTTSSSNIAIDYKYINTKVGKLETKRLSSCTNNIIKEGIILLPGKSVDIDVRVWISDDIANSEMGKSFYAKLSIDGLAVYNDNQEIDNSMLVYPHISLNTVEPGSYVKYTGNNGCEGNHCNGDNANYVDSTNKGYCNSDSYKFNVNGWRVAYVEDGSAHLVSAGAPECVNTYVDDHSPSLSSDTWSTSYYYGSGYTFDESTGKYTLTGLTSSALAWSSNYANIVTSTPYTCKGTTNNATCSSTMYKVDSTSTSSSVKYYNYYSYEQTNGLPKHMANLNNKALKYCNKAYAKNGVCNNTTAWAMNATDFEKITSTPLNSSSCNGTSSEACGKNNTLIDNNSYYWFATPYNNTIGTLFWLPNQSYVSYYNNSADVYGLRPVLALESSIIVTGGSGTEDDPYIISNPITGPVYLNMVAPGSYVAYTGDSANGCDDTTTVNGLTACSGKNANASSSNNGYCHNTSYQFNSRGWRVAYVEDGSAHLVSAGATDCICTNSDGTISSISCSNSLTSENFYKHIDNLNNMALQYCNKAYAKNGVCNNTTAWAMNATDFEKITGEALNSSSCNGTSSEACGKNNTLIDNNGYYWFATPYSASSSSTFFWAAETQNIYNSDSGGVGGVRPVLALKSTIRIVGGTGTYEAPYLIDN